MREISSAANERFRAFAGLCKDKKARDQAGLIVVDGAKLCADAAAAGHRIREVWITEEASEKYAGLLEGILSSSSETYLLRGDAAGRLSELKAPQGVFAVLDRPALKDPETVASHRRVLGLCGLQSPENAAAAVRTAAALGYGAVVLTADCADLWSPRSLRAGAGAQLELDVCVTGDMPAVVGSLRKKGFLAAAAALTGNAVPVQELERPEKLFLLVGNEGHGLPREVIDTCDAAVIIPMSGKVESLNANAAASVLMWELRERSST